MVYQYDILTKEDLESSWIDKKQGDEKKMETDELKTGIGNTEAATSLNPAIVAIQGARLEEVTTKKGKTKKLVCLVKHPDKAEPINISEIKYEVKGKLIVSGLWWNTDKEHKIMKGCALAIFLQSNGCTSADQLIGKQIQTMMDDKGYLCFKSY